MGFGIGIMVPISVGEVCPKACSGEPRKKGIKKIKLTSDGEGEKMRLTGLSDRQVT